MIVAAPTFRNFKSKATLNHGLASVPLIPKFVQRTLHNLTNFGIGTLGSITYTARQQGPILMNIFMTARASRWLPAGALAAALAAHTPAMAQDPAAARDAV